MRAVPLLMFVVVGASGCPPPRDTSKHDALCDEMLQCMFDDPVILEGAGKDRYQGLIEGTGEITKAFGPGGTCWTGDGAEGAKLRDRCHQECLCALGEACLDAPFQDSLCEHDVSAADCAGSEKLSVTSEKLTFEKHFADYVSTEDFSCQGDVPNKPVSCGGPDEPDCASDEICQDNVCVKNFLFKKGRCCHVPELDEMLYHPTATEAADFLPKCDGITDRERCERYPSDEDTFCQAEAIAVECDCEDKDQRCAPHVEDGEGEGEGE